MKKVIIVGTVLATYLCSALLPSINPASAKPNQEEATVKTAAQAANIARLHYLDGRRGIAYSGKPETISDWQKPTVTRSKSKQNNLLWNVLFSAPNKKYFSSFTITVAENGKVVRVINWSG